MAHVELSLSETFPAAPDTVGPAESTSALGHWAATVAVAPEPCLVLDTDARIVVASHSFCALLRLGDPAGVAGRYLLDGVLRLVDFTAARGRLTEVETAKIPPLLALSSGRLARGLMRVHDGADDGLDATVDAIATPLWDGTEVVGSLTFCSPI
ncbi:MAG TPA: hypothetical protein VNV66_21085 [Pilimelia sp.]|nr:hypothetical protein [Pilimelia sp.]